MNALRRRARALALNAETAMNAHDFSFKALAGAGVIDLKAYAGKVVLVVNVASKCGFTSQYRELEALYEAKAKNGLIVLGVPSNDFGGQEPSGEDAIRTFCTDAYHVTFPMTAKVEIVGQGRHPFYQWIAGEVGQDALPRWNFHKFLIGKTGELEGSFSSRAAPLGAEILSAIEKALSA